jgi:hypothetical protein
MAHFPCFKLLVRFEPVKTFWPHARAEQERRATLQPIESLPVGSDSAAENLHVALLFHSSHLTLLAPSHNRKTTVYAISLQWE